MRIRARSLSVTVLLACVAGASPAPASSDPAAAHASLASAEARLDRLAAALRTGSLSALVDRSPLALDGGPRGALSTIHALSAQVERSARAAIEAVRVDPDDLDRASAELRAALTGDEPDRFDRLAERWAHVKDGVDARAIHRAAADLVVAVERALPMLASARFASTGSGVACDVLDQAPVLCLAGEGPNVHTADYALTIDFGGDDTWLNRAGGADATLPGSLAIDLAGADTYRAPSDVFVQGASNMGIGVLVDVAGDDTYEAVNGQGLGFAGAGILADLDGDDSYRLADEEARDFGSSAIGQGYAVFGALGLAADLGGNDSYEIVAAPPSPVLDETGATASAASVGGFGVGAFAALGLSLDAGGADRFRLGAATAPIEPMFTGALGAIQVTTLGFGAGIGPFTGFGAHVTGPGATERSSTAAATAPTVQLAFTQVLGFGIGDGMAGAMDMGGDDVYTAIAITRASRAATIDDACGCGDEQVRASSGVPAVTSMGYGSIGGVGVLSDLGGDDVYTAEADASSSVVIDDHRTDASAGEPGADAFAVAGASQVMAQGATLVGVGLMSDAAGDDTYRSDATVTADAIVNVDDPDLFAPTTFAGAFDAMSLSQASATVGYAELRDLGGADTYTSTNLTVASAPGGEILDTGGFSSVQGSTSGLIVPVAEVIAPSSVATFLDLDGGAPDTFTAVPADPVCAGARGGAFWVDCAGGMAVGSAV